jgi:thiamine pyrophosphate-dependent acetolactate synthase large subunit-like protein
MPSATVRAAEELSAALTMAYATDEPTPIDAHIDDSVDYETAQLFPET